MNVRLLHVTQPEFNIPLQVMWVEIVGAGVPRVWSGPTLPSERMDCTIRGIMILKLFELRKMNFV